MGINLQGQWKGKCVYGPEYGDLENAELYFQIEFQQDEDTFTGIAIDTGGTGVNPGKASVSGFIEGHEISFVKQYNIYTQFQENGDTYIDKSKAGPEVEYKGIYDASSNSFKGEWAIHQLLDSLPEGYLEFVATGTWTLQRT